MSGRCSRPFADPFANPLVKKEHHRNRARRLALVSAFLLLAAALGTGCGLFSKKVDVLFIGDSIMRQSGPFVQRFLADEPGVLKVKTHVDAVSGTGLLTPKLVDWQNRARELIDLYQPKVVVVLFIGNYSDVDLWTGADGQPVANDYSDRFFAEWSAQAEKLTATLSSQGAAVDWVLPPPLTGAEGERREAGMRRTYEDLQARIPSIVLIDGHMALSGPSGEYVWSRPGTDGAEVPVREADSVHLTEGGGELMAQHMAKTVGPQLVALRANQQ